MAYLYIKDLDHFGSFRPQEMSYLIFYEEAQKNSIVCIDFIFLFIVELYKFCSSPWIMSG